MLYADDAGIVSKSAEEVPKLMAVIATVFEAAGLTVSEKKTEAMLLRTPDQASLTLPLVVEAAGQRYRRTTWFVYILEALSAKALASLSQSNEGSVSCGHASNGSARSGLI